MDFEKSDSVITMQLIIDKIKLPDVLLDIIKDYIYISRKNAFLRRQRNCLLNTINKLYNSYDIYNYPDRPSVSHCAKAYGFEAQKQFCTCIKCGEIIYSETAAILCSCTFLNINLNQSVHIDDKSINYEYNTYLLENKFDLIEIK